jgi:hypothetical protein
MDQIASSLGGERVVVTQRIWFLDVKAMRYAFNELSSMMVNNFRCQYICKVMRDRSALYDWVPEISDIDDILNGIFMVCYLHTMFSDGDVAFMKVRAMLI